MRLSKSGQDTTMRYKVSQTACPRVGLEAFFVVSCRLYIRNNKGISDGAGLPFVDILALNIRTEIAFGMFNDGCTSLYWKTQSNSFLA